MHAIKLLMGEHYAIYQLFVDPADVMHGGINRPRTYIYLMHKQRGVYLYDVFDAYARVKSVLGGLSSTQPSDYRVASAQQVALESMYVASVRGIPYQHVPHLNGLVLTPFLLYKC